MSVVFTNEKTKEEKNLPIAYLAIFGYGIITLLLIILKLGNLVNILFPLGAFIVGLTLFSYNSKIYVGFIWWLCFLTPLIRRLADFNGSYTIPSPILLAPYLAIFVASPKFFQKLPGIVNKGGITFILATLGIFYGYCVGCVIGSPIDATKGLLEWLSPIIFGCYLFIDWQSYPENKEATKKAFIWGIFLMGIYGIYQYLIAPEWERFWLINLLGEDAKTLILIGSPFGTPEPLGIRVWSTMNGPYTFASCIIPGLLLALNYRGPLQPVIASVGYLSFLLSSSRTAWIGWLISINVFFIKLKPAQQLRFVMLVLIALIAILPFLITGPFAELISSRVLSLTNLSEDGSGSERTQTYQLLLGQALSSFLGYGMSNIPSLGHVIDSAILLILFEFGWLGATPYLLGLFLSALSTPKRSILRQDDFLEVSNSFILGSLFMLPLAPTLDGETAIAIWGFIGLKFAGNKFYLNQEKEIA